MDKADRTDRLLALVLIAQMQGASQKDKIHQLSLAGFSNIEIADILETTTDVVAASLYRKRKARPSRRGSKANKHTS